MSDKKPNKNVEQPATLGNLPIEEKKDIAQKNPLHGEKNKTYKKSIIPLESRVVYDGVGITPRDINDQTDHHPIYQERVSEVNRPVDNEIHQIFKEYNITLPPKPNEITFIDTSIKDYQNIVKSLNRNTKLVFLDSKKDGVAQITAALNNEKNITTIHIISHGSVGELVLGSTKLTKDALANYKSQIESWGNHLNENADILFYGCDVAQGTEGLNFIRDLSHLTKADIAASTDITGNIGQKANWELEAKVGNIESKEIVIEAKDFNETLNAAPVISSTNVINMTSVNRTDSAPAGDSVNTFITRLGSQLTDSNGGDSKGIAITAIDNTNGTWQYSTNSGSTWTNITSVSDNNALVLADSSTNKIRFIPKYGYGGESTVTIRAWDQTTGSNGTYQNASSNGGTTAFSSNTATIKVLSSDNITSTTDVTLSSEFNVNTYTTSNQSDSSVVALNNGNFIVTWQSNSQDGASNGIYGQIVDYNGNKVGSEFRVNTTTAGDQKIARVSLLNNGNFVVVWASVNGASDASIRGQIYDQNGTKVGGELTLANHTAQYASYPSLISRDVTTLNDGSFIVTYDTDNGAGTIKSYYKRFNSSGTALTATLAVPTNSADNTLRPGVTALSNGGYAISWRKSDNVMYMQRFDSSDNRVGGEITVSSSSYVNDSYGKHSITELADGKIAIVWHAGATGTSPDGSGAGIYAKIYNADGTVYKATYLVNSSYTTTNQVFATVEAFANGGFVVTWRSDAEDGNGYTVVSKMYDSAGNATSGNVIINTTTIGGQYGASVAISKDGHMMVTWHSDNNDGDGLGIVGRVLEKLNAPVPASTSVTLPSIQQDSTDSLVFSADELAMSSMPFDTNSSDIKFGIAITSVSAGATWQYSTDSGTTWNNIPAVAANSALRLGANALVRYTPNNGFTGNVSLSYKLWDNNGATGSATVDTTVASTDYSTQIITATSAVKDTIQDLAYTSGSNEIQLHTSAGLFSGATVAALDNGNYVSTWQKSGGGVYMQLLSSTGAKVGSEITVDANGTGILVTKLANGKIALAWKSTTSNIGKAKILYPDGTTYVNTFDLSLTNGLDSVSSLVPTEDGGFLTTFQLTVMSQDAYYMKINPDGTVQKSLNIFGQFSGANEIQSKAVFASNGKYYGVWTVPDASGNGIKFVAYNANDTVIVNNVSVNTTTAGDQDNPQINIIRSGGIERVLVTWNSNSQDGSDYGVYAQIFDLSGNKVGGEFRLNSTTAGRQANAQILQLPNGGFVAAWESENIDGSGKAIIMRSFDINGNAVSSEKTINLTTTGNQGSPYLTINKNGDIMASWTSSALDNSTSGVYARIIEFNAAPQLTNTNISFTGINKNNFTSSGDTVSSLITSLGGNLSDTNLDYKKGIAITNAGSANGTWEYSLNGGSSWTSVGVVSTNSALLLADSANTKLRFVPNAGYTGTDTITFKAWDQTSGSEGSKVDTSNSGTKYSFSTDTATASLTVSVINAAPVITGVNVVNMTSISRTDPNPSGDLVGTIITRLGSQLTDADATGINGIAITAIDNSHGTWQYSTNGGTTWATITGVSDNNALLLANDGNTKIRFIAANGYGGYANITIRAWDQFSGTNGTYQDVSTNGGTAPFSSNTATVRVQSVTPYTGDPGNFTNDIQLNTYTTSSQFGAAITALDNNNFVTTWISHGQDGSGYGIYAQITDYYGNKIGSEFRVTTATAGDQLNPHVASLQNGNFIIVWGSNNSSSDATIRGQIYNVNGSAIGGEITLANHTAQYSSYPDLKTGDIKVLNDGSFIVTYMTWNGVDTCKTYYKRFASDGTALTATLSVPTNGADMTFNAGITALSNGGYAMAWRNFSDNYVYMQRFDSSNNRVGATIQVSANGYTAETTGAGAITELSDGKIIVVWRSGYGGGASPDGSGSGVVGKIYNADGTVYKSDFLINNNTFSDQHFPYVASTADGGFTVLWYSYYLDVSNPEIMARSFDSTGTALSAEWGANTTTAGLQSMPAVAFTKDNHFAMAWHSYNTGNNTYEVMGKFVEHKSYPGAFNTSVSLPSVQKNTSNALILSADELAMSTQPVATDSSHIKFGIAITSVSANATWQYSTDGGANWINMPAVSDISALRLGANALVKYVPNNGFTGNISLSYKVWDNNGATGAATVNTTVDTSLYSLQTATATSIVQDTIEDLSSASLGNEIQVPTSAGLFTNGEVAALDNGNFASTWSKNGGGVYMQLLSSTGSKVGGEITVDATGSNINITKLATGRLAVTWKDASNNAKAIVYNADGTVFISSFTLTGGINSISNLTAMEDGGFMAVFDMTSSGNDQKYIKINPDGTVQKALADLHAASGSNELQGKIAVASNGNYYGVWTNASDGNSTGITLRIYNSNDTIASSAIAVNTTTAGAQDNAQVHIIRSGSAERIIVTWGSSGQDGSDYGVYGQIFDLNGNKIGGEFRLNTTTAGRQANVDILQLPNGGFVAAWESENIDGSGLAIVMRSFDSAGNALSTEKTVNYTTTGNQSTPKLTISNNGNILVSWTSAALDNSTSNVYARIADPNIAPQLTNTNINLPAINEDPTNNTGSSISTIISDLGANLTDANINALKGIAITAIDNANGSWEYSTDGGTNWNAVGPVANNNALLLDSSANTKIRFIPNANYNGSSNITFRAWDQYSGAIGAKVDTTTNGGTTAFSADTATASIAINAQNDAPVLNNTPDVPLTNVTEDALNSAGDSISDIITALGGNLSDVDAGALSGIAITGVDNSLGSWEYSLDNGNNWNAIGSASDSNALLLKNVATTKLRFIPSTQNGGTSNITFRAWDQTTGSEGSRADASTNGGTTAFSTGTGTASLNITDVNDAPMLNSSTINLTNIAHTDVNNPGDSIASLITLVGADLTDFDNGALKGIAITNVDNALGTWEYSLDNGNNWNAIGAVANNNALLLKNVATTKVRFVPSDPNGGTATITFRAWDQTSGVEGNKVDASTTGGTTAFSDNTSTGFININAGNSAPVISNNPVANFTTIPEDNINSNGDSVSNLITQLGLNYTDADVGSSKGLAITAVDNSLGTWQYSLNDGLSWQDVGPVANNNALLLKNLSTTKLRFIPTNTDGATSNITFRAWDQTIGTEGTKTDTTTNGGGTPFSVATGTGQITITAVNDAPVLNNNPSVNFPGINDNDANNAGDSLANIIANLGVDYTEQNVGDQKGIAITGVGNTTLGKWQYSLNSGTTWIDVGAVSDNNALLLANSANTKMRFLPNGTNGGTASFTFRAWDQKIGVQGNKVDASNHGGSNPFSTDTGSASIVITTVNDAPVLNNTTVSLTSITTSDTNNAGNTISGLITSLGANLTDVDINALKGIAITAADNTLGIWQYSLDNGATWNDVGPVSNNSALLLKNIATTKIKFIPTDPNGGVSNITFRAWDQTSDAEGAKIDTTTNGGTTSLSTGTATASLTINKVVAPPVPSNPTTIISDSAPTNNEPIVKSATKTVEAVNQSTLDFAHRLTISNNYNKANTINFNESNTNENNKKKSEENNQSSDKDEDKNEAFYIPLQHGNIAGEDSNKDYNNINTATTEDLSHFYSKSNAYQSANTYKDTYEENQALKKKRTVLGNEELFEMTLLTDFYGIPEDLVATKTTEASDEDVESNVINSELFKNPTLTNEREE